MAAPLIGAAAGLGGIVAINKSGEDTVVWAARVDQMNCSQLRVELARFEKKSTLSKLNPLGFTGKQVAILKSTMIQRRCRMPA